MLKFLTVTALASFELYAAIPTGIAFDLSPWIIFISCVMGGLLSVYIAAFFGKRIKDYIARFRKPKEEKPKSGFIHKIWNKYGIIGLGLAGTFTVGAPITIAVGLSMKAPLKTLILWCTLGVVARSAVFTTIGHLGMKLI